MHTAPSVRGPRPRAFLQGRTWTHAEGPVALFNHAAGWLRRHQVLLPGVNVLALQVSEVRTIAEKRLHATVAKAARQLRDPDTAKLDDDGSED